MMTLDGSATLVMADTAVIDAPPLGAALGRYVVKSVLGRGGMGVVMEADDPKLRRAVAIKIVRTGQSEGGEEATAFRETLLEEAQTLARLSHPNVVAVYDVGVAPGGIFIAMELVVGRTLRSWMKGQRSAGELVNAFLQAGRGLAAAHAAGIVHRDFKPDNVLMGEDGRARVADFGIARAVGQDVDGQSARGPSGTPAYMAPEQLGGAPADGRSDQFSFAVSLLEAFAQRHPFSGGDRGAFSERSRAGIDPRLRPPSMPRHIFRALARALSLRPEDRYPDMPSLLAALERDPWASARRWAPLGVVAVAGVTAATAAVTRTAHTDPCEIASGRLHVIYGPAERSRMEDVFRRTRVPFAEQAARSVATSLETYAARWKGEYVDACRAARSSTLEGPKLRLECLEERRDAFVSAVDVLAQADATSMARVTHVADRIPAVVDCGDAERLRGVTPLPIGEVGERAQSVQRALLQAEALTNAGRYDLAAPIIEHAVADARALGVSRLTAEAEYDLGELLRTRGEFKPAAEAARDAVLRATEARADHLLARAWTLRVAIAGDGLGDRLSAEDFAGFARATLVRVNATKTQQADLERALGATSYRVGDFAGAVVHDETALALVQNETNAEQAALLNNLCIAYTDLARYEEALARCSASLELTIRQLGDNHPETAQTLSNFARARLAHGEAAAAVPLFRRSLAIRDANGAGRQLGAAFARMNLAAALIMEGLFAEAEREADESVAIFRTSEGSNVAFGLVNRGDAQRRQGRCHEALPSYEEAHRIWLRAFGPSYPNLLATSTGIGECMLSRAQNVEAKARFEEAIRIGEASLGPEHPELVEPLTGLGEVYLRSKRYAEAESALIRAQRLAGTTHGARQDRALLSFALARAVAPRDGALARDVAVRARDELAQLPAASNDFARVSRWIAAQPGLARFPHAH